MSLVLIPSYPCYTLDGLQMYKTHFVVFVKVLIGRNFHVVSLCENTRILFIRKVHYVCFVIRMHSMKLVNLIQVHSVDCCSSYVFSQHFKCALKDFLIDFFTSIALH